MKQKNGNIQELMLVDFAIKGVSIMISAQPVGKMEEVLSILHNVMLQKYGEDNTNKYLPTITNPIRELNRVLSVQEETGELPPKETNNVN